MKHLLLKLLPYNTHLYNFCKSYVEKHDGDCNGDMMTNGEFRLMRQFLPEVRSSLMWARTPGSGQSTR